MCDATNPLLRASPNQTAEACACALATIVKSIDSIALSSATTDDGRLVVGNRWRGVHLDGLAGLAACVEAALHSLADQLEDSEVDHG